MWTSARQCQVFVLEVTASTPLDPTSVNVPLATVRVKLPTNVKVSLKDGLTAMKDPFVTLINDQTTGSSGHLWSAAIIFVKWPEDEWHCRHFKHTSYRRETRGRWRGKNEAKKMIKICLIQWCSLTSNQMKRGFEHWWKHSDSTKQNM